MIRTTTFALSVALSAGLVGLSPLTLAAKPAIISPTLTSADSRERVDTGYEKAIPESRPHDALAHSVSAAASRKPAKRIRAKVINWIKKHDETTGKLSDFLLPGSDMAFHLEIDPRDEEVILEWDIRF